MGHEDADDVVFCRDGKGGEGELGSCIGQDGGGDALLFVGKGCGATGAVGRELSAQNQPMVRSVLGIVGKCSRCSGCLSDR